MGKYMSKTVSGGRKSFQLDIRGMPRALKSVMRNFLEERPFYSMNFGYVPKQKLH